MRRPYGTFGCWTHDRAVRVRALAEATALILGACGMKYMLISAALDEARLLKKHKAGFEWLLAKAHSRFNAITVFQS